MCSICLEENDQKHIFTKGYTFIKEKECYSIQCKCNIYIHDDCMRKWLNNQLTCPICVQPLKNNKIRQEIRDELKELYLFEILIILILIQINCILHQSNYYNLLLSILILTILYILSKFLLSIFIDIIL